MWKHLSETFPNAVPGMWWQNMVRVHPFFYTRNFFQFKKFKLVSFLGATGPDGTAVSVSKWPFCACSEIIGCLGAAFILIYSLQASNYLKLFWAYSSPKLDNCRAVEHLNWRPVSVQDITKPDNEKIGNCHQTSEPSDAPDTLEKRISKKKVTVDREISWSQLWVQTKFRTAQLCTGQAQHINVKWVRRAAAHLLSIFAVPILSGSKLNNLRWWTCIERAPAVDPGRRSARVFAGSIYDVTHPPAC